MSKSKKVLVFTDPDTWIRNISKKIIKSSWKDSYPDSGIPIRECIFQNNETVLQEVDLKHPEENASKEGVYLVYDEIDDAEFESLRKMCEDNELYVLTHSRGRDKANVEAYLKEKISDVHLFEGTHDNESAHHYYLVFKILTDNNDDKLNRIINEVFKPQSVLETVLLFLHGCLGGEKNIELDSAKATLCSIGEIEGVVEDFYENYFEPEGNEQNVNNKFSDLIKLREELLNYVSNLA